MNISTVYFLIFSCLTTAIFIFSIFKTKNNQSFQETKFLGFLGIFVWGDALIIAPFWIVTTLIFFFTKNIYFFLLTISVFWLVRSLGETIYWLNQQFSGAVRNPPEKLFGYQLVKSEAIWFIYQIFWQIILVASIISSIYFSFLWIKNMN